MADIDEIVRQLVEVEKTVPGVKQAFRYAPSGVIAPLPCFINLVGSGEVVTPRIGQGVRDSTVNIKAICLVAHQADSADAERIIRPLVYDFVEQVDRYKTLNGAANALSADVTGWEEPGPYTVGGQEAPFLAVPFSVQVMVHEVGITYGTTGG